VCTNAQLDYSQSWNLPSPHGTCSRSPLVHQDHKGLHFSQGIHAMGQTAGREKTSEEAFPKGLNRLPAVSINAPEESPARLRDHQPRFPAPHIDAERLAWAKCISRNMHDAGWDVPDDRLELLSKFSVSSSEETKAHLGMAMDLDVQRVGPVQSGTSAMKSLLAAMWRCEK